MGNARSFAKKLHALRKMAGISQGRVAESTGLSKRAISRLESGESQPSWETVQLLAAALMVGCQALVDEHLALPVCDEFGRPGRPRNAQRQRRKST
jgi:transcriptional regulator with XRE-family HTH domain